MSWNRSDLTLRLGLCLLSAALTCFSFPNFLQKTLHPPFAFFAWFSLVPFFMALRGTQPREGALLGYFFGFSHLGGILYWIALLEEAKYLSFPAWAALVGYLSIYFCAFGFLFVWLRKKTALPGPLLAPVLWVALEHFRGTRPWGGFGWGELGYSQAPYPVLLQSSTFAGIFGLTFLMVWTNSCLEEGLARTIGSDGREDRSRGLRHILPPLIVLIFAILWGERVIGGTRQEHLGSAVLLQPSIDQAAKWSRENEDETYEILGDLSRKGALAKPSLVVWPETAVPAYLLTSPQVLQRVDRIVRATHTFHLVGCLHQEYQSTDELRQYNAAVAFDGKGNPEGFYGKGHLVPFGEFVPFQKFLTFLGPVVGDLGTFSRGPCHRCFHTGGFTYAPMICYEAVFPGDVRAASRTGAQVLVNISNDAWYGRTASAYQHAMMAVAACAGVRKPLLRAANTGICLATDPFGQVLVSTALFDRRTLEVPVLVAGKGPTLYERWGDWLPWSCWGLLLFWVLVALRKGHHEPT